MPGVGPSNYGVHLTGFYHSDVAENLVILFRVHDHVRVKVDGAVVFEYSGAGGREREYQWAVTPGDHRIEVEFVHGVSSSGDAGESKCVVRVVRREKVDLAKLTKAATESDVVVFVGGLNQDQEREETDAVRPGTDRGDRLAIEVPSIQTAALKALKAGGKPVVFAICSGRARGRRRTWMRSFRRGTLVRRAALRSLRPYSANPTRVGGFRSQCTGELRIFPRSRTIRWQTGLTAISTSRCSSRSVTD
jgi:hypothetical protein